MKLRCAYCGSKHNIPTFFLKLWNLFFDEYFFTCQKCLKYNCYGLYLRVYHDSTNQKERMANKLEKRV